jgi:hypothetical protein
MEKRVECSRSPDCMASTMTFRVRYDGEDGEEERTVLLENNKVDTPDFLEAIGLAYARTEDGRFIYSGRTGYVEEEFLVDGLVICGPRIRGGLDIFPGSFLRGS